MTTPILSAVIIASLLMVAGIELLAQKSQRQGGLALSPSLKEIPQYAMITSQYIPQVLAVCYSLVWSWIDLDVKRMQPWFELSKPGGALATDSLLLDYPFTFMAFVPFKAAQRRHWLVFLSGLSMMLVFWAITPLQSAQLGTGSVQRAVPRGISARSKLVPVEQQENLLTSKIINLAYAIAWLDQPVPGFTTPEAAYLPFYVNDPIPYTTTTKTNWTGETVRLSTELDCWPAELVQSRSSSANNFNFLNGQDCNASVSLPQDSLSMFYIGYYSSAHSSYWLADPQNCPKTEDSVHQFLATWADIKGTTQDETSMEFNVSGSYCQTKYLKQKVRVTVDATTLEPDASSVEELAPAEILPESEFNSTAFEYLIGHGMEYEFKERDYPESIVNEQTAWMADRNLSTPSSNMVPFAFARDNRSVETFSDPQARSEAFNTAHQYLFAFTVSQLLENGTEFVTRDATATSFMAGIVVNRSISAALEALILLFAIFTGLIIYFVRKSSTNLDKNPSSLQRLAEICQNQPQILDSFCSMSHADESTLAEATKTNMFRLVWNDDVQSSQLPVDTAPTELKSTSIANHQQHYHPVKPAALRRESGVAFVVAILGVIGGLIYLKWAEAEYKGSCVRLLPEDTVETNTI